MGLSDTLKDTEKDRYLCFSKKCCWIVPLNSKAESLSSLQGPYIDFPSFVTNGGKILSKKKNKVSGYKGRLQKKKL